MVMHEENQKKSYKLSIPVLVNYNLGKLRKPWIEDCYDFEYTRKASWGWVWVEWAK